MSGAARMIRNIMTLGIWTLVSRGAGLARDLMMANYLGAGAVADAFNVAFSLPNMFRRFFAEGAFNQAFVPIYAKKLEAGEDAETFAQDAFAGLSAILLALVLIGTVAMPFLVWAMASGFVGDARFDLAVTYGRITFCYIFFISLFAMLAGVLNAHGRFAEAGFVPVLMNLVFIAAMWLAAVAGWDMGLTLAWTVPVTGVAQLAFTWVAASRIGFVPRLRMPQMTPDLKRLLIIAGPAMLAGGVVQVNLLVSRQVASGTEGAISWLVYADRLYQLPLGVVAIAVGTVLLPELSRRLRANDAAGGQDAFNRGTEFALVLTLPLYFAREDTRSPFRYAVWSMVTNAVLAVGLMPLIGFTAAALATTLSAWIMVGQLWWGARRMGPEAQFDDRLMSRLRLVLMACVAMVMVVWAGALLLQPWLQAAGWRYPALALLVGLGGVAYFGSGFALKAFRWSELKGLRGQR